MSKPNKGGRPVTPRDVISIGESVAVGKAAIDAFRANTDLVEAYRRVQFDKHGFPIRSERCPLRKDPPEIHLIFLMYDKYRELDDNPKMAGVQARILTEMGRLLANLRGEMNRCGATAIKVSKDAAELRIKALAAGSDYNSVTLDDYSDDELAEWVEPTSEVDDED